MKNYIISLLFIFSSSYFFGQCPTSEIVINSQQDIDSFAVNYPNCTELSTNLLIQGAGITNLNGLSQITSIMGNLIIGGFNLGTSITNLSGLDNLETISGKLDINRNSNLETLSGLSKLTEVGSTQVGSGISISLNPSLLNLNGLNGLNRVNNSFNIQNNVSLTTIDALANLHTLILGNFLTLTIQGNNSLSSLTGLEGISTISGGLVISDNGMTNLNGLNNLVEITSRLAITNSATLINFEGLNSLQSIGSDLQIETNSSLLNLQGLDALNSISGNVRIAHNGEMLNLNGSQNLVLIDGDFTIFNNEKLDDFSGLAGLSTINGNVEIRSNELLQNLTGLSSLATINQELQIRDNPSLETLVGLESLEFIGLDLQININPNLQNINGLDNLKTVTRHLEISQNASLEEISALANLETIGGDLSLSQNPLLPNLIGLEKITEIGRNMYIGYNASLSNFTGLNNLESILSSSNINNNTTLKSLDGLSSLKTVNAFEFELSNNTELTNINGLENLSQIKGDLILHNNDSLVDFTGLESLNYIEGTLSINDNEKLESLSGIQNIDNESISNLVIEDNPALAVCEALSICNYLSNTGPRSITNNQVGCDTEVEILNRCGSALNLITGQILYDEIGDGCDLADYPVLNQLIQATNGTKVFSNVTDSTGVFNIYVSEGSYTTTSLLNEDVFTISPPNQYSTFENLKAKDTIDFCVTKLIEAKDLQITILPLTEARPGFESSYSINYNNKGTETISGNIELQFDGDKLTFLEASKTTSSQTPSSISFNYTNLKPFETESINATFTVLAPPTANIDDTIEFTGTINPVDNDYLPEDNIFHLEQTLIGSYDPNDISVVEGDSISIEDKDKYLNYIIRFQNTGTASAINVNVAHELDSNLDWSSFTFLSSSHTSTTAVENGNEVTFLFEDINLPDSNSNEVESHGYLAFKIKPKSTIQIGDIISGNAEIYFDFNPAIITNTVTTEIVQDSDLPLQVLLSSYANVKCNGENNGVLEVNTTGGKQPYTYELLDGNDTTISSGTSNIFTDLPPGQYSVLVTDANLSQKQSAIIVISEPEFITASFSVNELTCFNSNDGQATLMATGGSAPYEFSIDSGNTFQTSASFENLDAGSYSGIVRDANGCQADLIFEISQGLEINDCSVFSLPSDNFKIQVTSETCASSNNGSILITASENQYYLVTLKTENGTIDKSFSTFTSFQNLEADNYEICITVIDEAEFEKCFSVQVTEPEKLIVESNLDSNGKLVTLKMQGANKYDIDINGTSYSTTDNSITIPLLSENNSISVTTDIDCQGQHTETILSTYDKVSVYPNPVEKGEISIQQLNNTESEVLLTLFSINGIRVLEKMEKSDNSLVKLNMDGFPAGIYTIIIKTESSNKTAKIIKK